MKKSTVSFEKIRNIATAALLAAAVFGLSLANLLHTPPEVLKSERRKPAAFPQLTVTAGGREKLNPKFARQFESYALDGFIGRDLWRSVKAYARYNAFRQLDNNGLYAIGGSVAEIRYLDEAAVLITVAKLSRLIEKLPEGVSVYCAAVPDKGYYLARGTAYPAFDFDRLEALIAENLTGAKYIGLKDALAASSYYNTDLHWKQTELSGVLGALGGAMGFADRLEFDFSQEDLSPFYGGYSGQFALKLPADALSCLTNGIIANARVKLLDTKTLEMTESVMYDASQFSSVDPYSVYLSGPQAVVTIENPNAATDRRLYIFRDSFTSSLAPLLTSAYAEITLIDLRYIASPALFKLVSFDENADVLFLYGSVIFNDGTVLMVG